MMKMKKNILLMILIFFIAVAAFPAAAPAQSADTLAKAESDGLGMIIKSIEMVETKPIIAAIFNTRTGKTVEYTVGDYAEGKLVRDILEDRVILFDELTKYQHVLIFNDIVMAAEDDGENSTPVTKIRTKKRDDEDMNVTLQFNKYLNRSKGKELKYGAVDEASENAEKTNLNKTTRDFKPNTAPIENKAAVETEAVKPAAKVEVTVSTNEVKVDTPASKKETPASTETPDKETSSPAKTGAAPAPSASDKTATSETQVSPAATKDGKQVKIR